MPPPGLQIYLRRRVTLTLELLTLKVNHFIRLVTDDSCMSEEEVRPQCHGSRGRLTKICIAWLAFQWYEKTFLRLKYFSSSSTMCSKWTNLHSLVVTTLDCQPVSFKPLYLVSHYPRPLIGSRIHLERSENDLTLTLICDLDMRIPRFFSSLCNYRAENKYLQYFHRGTHTSYRPLYTKFIRYACVPIVICQFSQIWKIRDALRQTHSAENNTTYT